jgi:hypothetical protein
LNGVLRSVGRSEEIVQYFNTQLKCVNAINACLWIDRGRHYAEPKPVQTNKRKPGKVHLSGNGRFSIDADTPRSFAACSLRLLPGSMMEAAPDSLRNWLPMAW